MRFYGVSNENTSDMYGHLLQVREMFDRAKKPIFFGDNGGSVRGGHRS